MVKQRRYAMNKLILSTLLILTPITLLPAKKLKTKTHQTTKHHKYAIEEEKTAKKTICTPETIQTVATVGGTVFVATLQVIVTILTLVLH